MNSFNRNRIGCVAKSVKLPIIREGDDLEQIVVDCVIEAVGVPKNKTILGVTEAVVAIAQGNFATAEDVQKDIAQKFLDVTEIALVDMIQSRNRFKAVLEAIAGTPQLKKVYVIMGYPTDEVGNRMISDEAIVEAGINPYTDCFTVEEFYELFGEPSHEVTKRNYISEYQQACHGKAEILLCNNLARVPEFCKNVLVCTIHEPKRSINKKILKKNGAERVFDLSDILKESIDGSGYNSEFGLYGTNVMDNKLKLMPRDCQKFVYRIKNRFKVDYGTDVEVMVYGDGAFKDPVTKIWELADPRTSIASTSGLKGSKNELKLKLEASKYPDATDEELEKIIEEAKARIRKEGTNTGEASLGTTPREIAGLVGSMFDLMSGSGDAQTPVVIVSGYLK